MLKETWFRSLYDKSRRFKIYTAYPDIIELPNKLSTIGFHAVEYHLNNEGEWDIVDYRACRYITIDALLNLYVAEDTYLSKYVEDLELFKKDAFERASMLKQEGFDKIYDIYKDGLINVTSGTVKREIDEVFNNQILSPGTITDIDEFFDEENYKKWKAEYEGNKENIHTLHSGESETDPSSAPEGVQE